MQFLNFLRFLGLRKIQPPSPIFPSDWPSYLHSKCSTPTCWFPNPPQAAAGMYNCQARPSGSYCRGTYQVTSAMAESVIRKYKHARKVEAAKAKEMVEVERLNRKHDVQKKPSRISIFGRDSQRTLKNSFRKQEYLKDKSLPGIPGLSQRNQNRRPLAPPVPPVPAEATRDLQPLYPQVVLHYYFPQDQPPTPVSTAPRKAALTYSPSPLAPQRRPPSGNYLSNPLYGLSPSQYSLQAQGHSQTRQI